MTKLNYYHNGCCNTKMGKFIKNKLPFIEPILRPILNKLRQAKLRFATTEKIMKTNGGINKVVQDQAQPSYKQKLLEIGCQNFWKDIIYILYLTFHVEILIG